jgi:hypothetical protein
MSEGTLGEKRETYSLLTFAKRFGVSRVAIVNDDLDGFGRIPAAYGASRNGSQGSPQVERC